VRQASRSKNAGRESEKTVMRSLATFVTILTLCFPSDITVAQVSLDEARAAVFPSPDGSNYRIQDLIDCVDKMANFPGAPANIEAWLEHDPTANQDFKLHIDSASADETWYFYVSDGQAYFVSREATGATQF
jgi:hypothetical protein